jgi:hypothetical protein
MDVIKMENEKMVNNKNIGKGNEILYREINRQRKRAIHTTLKPSDINKLEEYGDGRLNTGIEKVLEIAESKQFNVKEQLIKIASQIMVDEEIRDFSSMN